MFHHPPQNISFVSQINAYISAGGYTRESALQTAEQKGDLIASGRLYISTPDLPRRLKEDIPLSKGDRGMYYLAGDLTPKGYSEFQIGHSLRKRSYDSRNVRAYCDLYF
ncbi:hypothetical protein BJ138DRAFT_1164051 [Hygrophoropsis aurantiaca]|uniref:Uncharacterized protein n=1 Tax=Hygrophoropsis aurantiaca TaxID=72124 RepID=A0ACB7ZXC2_9AGAM|nr:hypothetical protein BJ138DRAFT_1164051 [Hygrophoropsis aurantiaca]